MALLVIGVTLIVISTSSCSSTRKANRGVKKLEKLKIKYADVWQEVSTETVRIDTVIQEVHIPGQTQVVVDSSAVDSLARELQSLMNAETSEGNEGDIVRETITRYVPRLITVDTVQVDTFDIHMTLFYDKTARALMYEIQRDSIKITKEESVDKIAPIQYITVHKIPWWMWAVVGVLTIVILRLIFK